MRGSGESESRGWVSRAVLPRAGRAAFSSLPAFGWWVSGCWDASLSRGQETTRLPSSGAGSRRGLPPLQHPGERTEPRQERDRVLPEIQIPAFSSRREHGGAQAALCWAFLKGWWEP